MKSLTQIEHEVLTLTAAEQLSPAEIAVVLDMKQNTVRTHLHRARNKLRSALTTEAPRESVTRTKRIDGAGHERTERQSLRFSRTQGAQ
jgi:RNA polymerase sigma-70 factor (ECF subfamily)